MIKYGFVKEESLSKHLKKFWKFDNLKKKSKIGGEGADNEVYNANGRACQEEGTTNTKA